MKRVYALTLKASISIVLLVCLFHFVDIEDVFILFLGSNFFPLALAVLVMLLAIIISSFKWKQLLWIDGIKCSLVDLCRYYLVGIYFNNFLPTSIGGDAARAFLVAKKFNKTVEVLSSIFVERFTGLLALLVYAVLAILLEPRISELELRGPIIVFLLLALGGGVLLLSGRAFNIYVRLLPDKMKSKMNVVNNSLRSYFFDSRTRWVLAWTSLIYPFLVIFVYFLVSQSLNIPVSFGALAVSVPLVTLLTLIPFSLNGLGLREGGFVFLLSEFGVPKAGALSISLMGYGLTLLLSLGGGLAFMLMRRGPSKSKNDVSCTNIHD